MNLKIKKILAVSLILVLSMVVVGAAGAQNTCPMNKKAGSHCRSMGPDGPGSMSCPGMGDGIGGIGLKQIMSMDLTDAQKTKVANVLAARRAESRQLADSLCEARQTFFDDLDSKKADDETAVRQAFRQMSEIMENQVVLKTKIMAELKPVLSKDQLMALTDQLPKKSWDRESKKRMKKQREVHRAMMDTWISTYADAPEANE